MKNFNNSSQLLKLKNLEFELESLKQKHAILLETNKSLSLDNEQLKLDLTKAKRNNDFDYLHRKIKLQELEINYLKTRLEEKLNNNVELQKEVSLLRKALKAKNICAY